MKSAFDKTTLKYIIYVILIAFVTLFLVMSCEPQQEPSYVTYHQNHQNSFDNTPKNCYNEIIKR